VQYQGLKTKERKAVAIQQLGKEIHKAQKQ